MLSNNHRITFRFNDTTKGVLEAYKLLLHKRGINMSKNELIQSIINGTTNHLNISPKDVKNIKDSYKSSDYKKVAKNASNLFNAINKLNRKVSGACNNLNQMTRMLHKMARVNDDDDFKQFMPTINNYKQTINDTKNIISKLQKEAINQWLKM